ncbi:hypothetical protein [Streptomyces nitrosporeus]|uniref:hypothetical protein n=1 Tax=Streptomyces nitrosporeus TaxID=28894 RepID=UPI00399F76B9
MNTPQRTRRTLRAAEQIHGARAGRRHLHRTAVIGRQLNQIAPGATEVVMVPVTVDDRRRTWVIVTDALGLPLGDRAAGTAAAGLLHRAFPGADWSRPQRYDIRTGHLTADAPTVPGVLGIETAEAGR